MTSMAQTERSVGFNITICERLFGIECQFTYTCIYVIYMEGMYIWYKYML